jgi:hypothetical protein
MTSLEEFEKNIGNHEIYLDAASPGANPPGFFVPCSQYLMKSYNSIGDQYGFKRDKNEVFDKFMGGTVSHVKNNHILDKKAVYVNETDRERINPANLLQFNRRESVPANQQYASVYGDGISKVGHNKNHYKGRINPAGLVFGTRLNDPHCSNPNQRAGPNQGITDVMRTKGAGSYGRGAFSGEYMQQIDKSAIGTVRTNPNKVRGAPECRIPGYLIDGLIANPESIYHDNKPREQPQFFCDTTANFNQYNQSMVKPCGYKPENTGVLYNIDPRLNTHNMLFY